jgi:copper chaperone CopZ
MIHKLTWTGLCALTLVACSKSEAADANAKAVLDLGKSICKGCVAAVRGALEGVAGVARIDIAAGTGSEFTVHYDNARIQPDAILKKLHEAGEKKATIKS